MSKKVLNYAGRRPMLLALIMATLTLGLLFSGWLTPTPGRAQNGSQNPQPNAENCDNPTTTTNCAASAQLVLKNVTISPAAPTNAPYDCIVCVCDSVSAHLQWFTIPSTNVTQTCHTCKGSTPTNYCDPVILTNGATPYNITNEWWNSWWWNYDFGYGDSVPSFTFTNATTGGIWFDNISAMMTTNAPGCDVTKNWATNAHSGRSYAFVEVTSLTPDMGVLIATNPDTYVICVVPTNSPITNLTVTASPNPRMPDDLDKFLPPGWQMGGGMLATNSNTNDVPISRTKRLVDLTTPNETTITCISGCSSKTVKIIVAKIEVKAKSYHHRICNPPIVSSYYFDNPQNGCADNLLGLWQEDTMKLTVKIQPSSLINIMPNDFIRWSSSGFSIPDNTISYFFYWDHVGMGEVTISLPYLGIGTTVYIDRPDVGETSEFDARIALLAYLAQIGSYATEASSWAAQFPNQKANALRHAYWTSMIASDEDIGSALAIYYVVAHEYSSKYGDSGLDESPYSDAPDTDVDLHNDFVGAGVIHSTSRGNNIFGNGPDYGAIRSDLLQRYDGGELWILDDDWFIRKSDNSKLYGQSGCCCN